MKIHETLKPRSWWLHELLKYGLKEDEQTMRQDILYYEDVFVVPLLLSKLYTRIYIHQAPVPIEESCRIRNSYIQKTYQNRDVTHHKRTQTRPHEEIRLK